MLKRQRLSVLVDPENQIYAVVFPILPKHIERIFKGRDVFIKYTRESNLRIGRGTKILFYGSRTGHKIFCEGTVRAIEFLSPDELVTKYADRLFISAEELESCRAARSSKPLVMHLQNKVKYNNPIILRRNLTMAGLTLTEEGYNRLIGEN
jgi:hypothetical protein